jgi:EmrB/QacA subfamily drug resistance transporter
MSDVHPPPLASSAPAGPHVNPWVPMSVVMGATMMVVLDTTIVNVALHEIGVDLGAGEQIEWVVTAYLLAVCASQPATGWLSDRFGRKPIFLGSLAAFTFASALCAFAPTLGWLVFFRVLQGLGGGALMPVGMTMVLELFPRERHGRAVSIWGMAVMVAPAIGPTVGGWLVTSVSWHWLFLINVPIGAGAIVAGLRLLPNIGHREKRPFDLAGLLFGTIGLTLAVLGVSQGTAWGWTAPSTLTCIVVGLGLLGAFVLHELHTEHPLIELRMFAEKQFRLAMGALVFVMGANLARLVFVPLQLESLRGFTALRVGMMFFLPAIAMAIGMSRGGWLLDRIGPRRPIILGCVGMFIAMLGFSQLTLTTPIWVVVALLSLQGLGMGVTMSPLMVAGLSDLPPQLIAQGTAIRSLLGQVAGAVSVAVLGAVVSSNMGSDPTAQQSQDAYNSAFVWAAAGVLVALVLAFRFPRRAATSATAPSESVLAALE